MKPTSSALDSRVKIYYFAGKKAQHKNDMAEDNRPLALQRDPYGENIKVMKFDWRDEQILRWIDKFVEFGQKDTKGNVVRQNARRTGALLRSIYWRTWNTSGGDMQVFEARYKYYAKFVELALGKNMPFKALPPGITRRKWDPSPCPTVPERPSRALPPRCADRPASSPPCSKTSSSTTASP